MCVFIAFVLQIYSRAVIVSYMSSSQELCFIQVQPEIFAVYPVIDLCCPILLVRISFYQKLLSLIVWLPMSERLFCPRYSNEQPGGNFADYAWLKPFSFHVTYVTNSKSPIASKLTSLYAIRRGKEWGSVAGLASKSQSIGVQRLKRE